MQHPDDTRVPEPQPGLVGLDWGTSSLRAYLLDGTGRVVDRRARPWGIQHLPAGGYAEAFQTVVGDWRDRWPETPVIAAGMVGSRTGWREVPYVECPADVGAIAAGILPFESECGLIHLVPGLLQSGSAPDVMRGEESQIIGALEREPALAADALVVLPGTHCKWARIHDSRVTGFTTYLTGEQFAMLRDHSIIGRPARDAVGGTDASRAAAFSRGVAAARASGAAGIAGKLFTTRSLFLCGELAAADTLDYLSGLLVGEELRSVLATLGGACPPCVLVGDPTLCSRYRDACAVFGIEGVRSLDETGPLGLWRIASAAGLLPGFCSPIVEPACRG
ncbi:MAG: 2-dehydro-3-deoxygalactonokinase [Planctomycetia bacterium]|nr:2-dehydro-3-deoxygalactonokinase [Planctomycetia bacterium]